MMSNVIKQNTIINAVNRTKVEVPMFRSESGFTTTKKRSIQMSMIRRKDTKPELRFRSSLYKLGIRYRVDSRKLPGRPDISNISKKIAIFIDGEFWHGYDWENQKHKIKSNRVYWIPKIERNMQRDAEVNMKLHHMGFKVFRFWAFRVNKNLESCLEEVLDYLK